MSVAVVTFAAFAASQVGTPAPAKMALVATGSRFGICAALPLRGVIPGKQLISWPIGFGLVGRMSDCPNVSVALKWASVAYVFWLAWKVARSRPRPNSRRGWWSIRSTRKPGR